jgi:hypothetical protein
MTCCSGCSRSAKRRPHSMAKHYVLHLNSLVELHAIDDLREPFKPRCRRQLRSAHRPRACRSSQAYLARQTSFRALGPVAHGGEARLDQPARTPAARVARRPSTLVLRPIKGHHVISAVASNRRVLDAAPSLFVDGRTNRRTRNPSISARHEQRLTSGGVGDGPPNRFHTIV